MTDWKLINQAAIGINWLKEINEAGNIDKTLRQLIDENEASLFLKDERVLNNGVLMMAAYMLFIYPREKEFSSLDFSTIDISAFRITMEEGNNGNPNTLCRRIRNSISHGKFEVKHVQQIIKFRDEYKGQDKIEFEIHTVDFGNFIDHFILEVDKQVAGKSQPNK